MVGSQGERSSVKCPLRGLQTQESKTEVTIGFKNSSLRSLVHLSVSHPSRSMGELGEGEGVPVSIGHHNEVTQGTLHTVLQWSSIP